MKKKDNITIFLLILILLITIPSYCNEKTQEEASVQAEGWSSVDYVFFKQEQDILTKSQERIVKLVLQ